MNKLLVLLTGLNIMVLALDKIITSHEWLFSGAILLAVILIILCFTEKRIGWLK